MPSGIWVAAKKLAVKCKLIQNTFVFVVEAFPKAEFGSEEQINTKYHTHTNTHTTS